MTGRVNAREAIRERAEKIGWTQLPCAGPEVDLFTDGFRLLRVRYEMFGSLGSKRMMDWYGKDTSQYQYINWGVAEAQIKIYIEREGGNLSWATQEVFTGAKKREQILAWLKDNSQK